MDELSMQRLDRLALLMKQVENKKLIFYGAGKRGKAAVDNIKQISERYNINLWVGGGIYR